MNNTLAISNSNLNSNVYDLNLNISDNFITIMSFLTSNDSFPSEPIMFNTDQLTLLRTSSKIISGFSIIGLIFVQVVFWFFKSIRTFSLELVTLLCFSNMMFNISEFFPIKEEFYVSKKFGGKDLSGWCMSQALMNIFFHLSSILWTTIIGYTAYISVAYKDHFENNKMRYRVGYILIAYLIPLIISLM